jgi:hypothetical protein
MSDQPQPIQGVYLDEVTYSYAEFKDAEWNMALLRMYPVNIPWLNYWEAINEALFKYFYEDSDEGELEHLLNSHLNLLDKPVFVDDYVVERLAIGFKILNALASPVLVNTRMSFVRIAEEVGISLADLENFIPEMESYYDWDEVDKEIEFDLSGITDLFEAMNSINKFKKQSKSQVELRRFKKSLSKTGHEVISYRFKDFKESEGKLFSKLFVYLLNVIAQRKRVKIREYVLEYKQHSDYVKNSYGLRKKVDETGHTYLHDDLIDEDFEIEEILKRYRLHL